MNRDDEPLIMRYIDRELPKTERDAFEKRLETDTKLREIVDNAQKFDEIAREAYPVTAFSAPTAIPRRRSSWTRPLAAAAAVLLVLALGSFGWAAVKEFVLGPSEPEPVISESGGVAPPSDGTQSVGIQSSDTSDPSKPTASADTSKESLESVETAEAADTTYTLSGVVENFDGEPIPGARIWLANPPREAARADALGNFEANVPVDVQEITAYATGYGPAHIWGSAVFATDVYARIRLPWLEWVEGRVVDLAGKPVSGAEVKERKFYSIPGLARRATTDAAGRYRIALPPQSNALEITHADYVSEDAQVQLDGHVPGVVLEPGGSLEVTVHVDGDTVPGVYVELSPSSSGSADTDDEGVARFENLRAADYSVFAYTGETFIALERFVKVQSHETTALEMEIQTGSVAVVEGIFEGLEGSGADSKLQIKNVTMAAVGHRRDIPVNDGQYRIEVAPGYYTLEASLQGLGHNRTLGLPRRDVIAEPGGHYREDFVISAMEQRKFRIVRGDGSPISEVVSGSPYTSSGAAEIIVEFEEGIGRVFASRVALSLYDPKTGMVNEEFRWLSADGDTIVLDQPATRIAGSLQDMDGHPIPNAKMHFNLVHSGDEPVPPFYSLETVTNSSGGFSAGPAHPGRSYYVHYGKLGYHPIAPRPQINVPSDGIADISLRLARAEAEITGHVLARDGTAVQNAEVYLLFFDDILATVKTNADGAFRLYGAAQEYELRAGARGLHGETLRIQAPAADIVLVVPLATGLEVVPPDADRTRRKLQMTGLGFKMFANEAPGEKYPPLSPVPGIFGPVLDKVYPEYIADSTITEAFSGRFAYLGYAVTEELEGMALLDAYELLGPAAISGNDIDVPEGTGTGDSSTIFQLREGIERFLITDINDPAASSNAQSQLPIMWEIPGNRPEPGGWVLYLDGHVEWEPYPGRFPMTEAFIERLKGLMQQD